MADRSMSDDEADHVVRALRDIFSSTGRLPTTAIMSFEFVRTHNPALAASLEETYGPLPARAPILLSHGDARPLTDDDCI
jgi:hypothetical protein